MDRRPTVVLGTSSLLSLLNYRSEVQITPTIDCRISAYRARSGIRLLLWSLSIVVAVGVHATADAASRFVPLGDLPGGTFHSIAGDVSADGSVVVGTSAIAGVQPAELVYEAFRWHADAGLTGLGDLPGGQFASYALAVSADGRVIVGESSSTASDCCDEAFRWSLETGLTPLGDLPGGFDHSQSSAQDVSADGSVVVGIGSSTASVNGEPFRWTSASGLNPLLSLPQNFSSNTALGVSADGEVIVGRQLSAKGVEAYRWTAETGAVGLDDENDRFQSSEANAVSADGLVVVGRGASPRLPVITTIPVFGDPSLMTEAFRWTESSGLVGLGIRPGGDFSIANDVSADGSVVVGIGSGNSQHTAIVWTSVNGWENIADLLSQSGIDLDGWKLEEATGISANGTIVVGYGTNPDGNTEAWRADLTGLVGVPEPSTGLLAVLSLGLWGVRRYRFIQVPRAIAGFSG